MKRIGIVLACVLLATVAFVDDKAIGNEATPPASGTPVPIVRDQLVAATPVLAPEEVLELVEYVIQPGTELPAHTHPGTQIAWISSGTLHYVVIEGGSVQVTRSNGATEQLDPGESTDLKPGDSVIEQAGVVHFGENRTEAVVVILAATLLDPSKPAAEVVELEASPAANS